MISDPDLLAVSSSLEAASLRGDKEGRGDSPEYAVEGDETFILFKLLELMIIIIHILVLYEVFLPGFEVFPSSIRETIFISAVTSLTCRARESH